MKSVLAKFPTTSKTYEYFVPDGDEPQVGDIIITSIRFPLDGDRCDYGHDLIKAARVVSVNEIAGPVANKFYVQLLSIEDIKERSKRYVEMREKEKQRAAARAALDEKVRLMDRMSDYERLALSDPEAAELLKILKAVND